MEHIKTLHVIGFKNSGKTTLVSNWVRLAKEKGLNVAVLKHHGHGAKLAMPDETKDSMQYLLAGADASLVAGAGFTQHMLQNELNYEQLLTLAKWQNPDVILIEGYKAEAGEKVILVRNDEDWEDLQKVDDISLVVGLGEAVHYDQIANRTEKTELDTWFANWLQAED